MIRKCLFSLFLISLLLGCAHKVKLDESKARFSTEPSGGGFSATVTWLKNKGGAIDLLMTLQNGYDQSVSIPKEALMINVGGQPGRLKRSEFKETFNPNDRQAGVMIFTFEREIPESGSAIVTISPLKWSDAKTTAPIPPLKFELPLSLVQ